MSTAEDSSNKWHTVNKPKPATSESNKKVTSGRRKQWQQQQRHNNHRQVAPGSKSYHVVADKKNGISRDNNYRRNNVRTTQEQDPKRSRPSMKQNYQKKTYDRPQSTSKSRYICKQRPSQESKKVIASYIPKGTTSANTDVPSQSLPITLATVVKKQTSVAPSRTRSTKNLNDEWPTLGTPATTTTTPKTVPHAATSNNVKMTDSATTMMKMATKEAKIEVMAAPAIKIGSSSDIRPTSIVRPLSMNNDFPAFTGTTKPVHEQKQGSVNKKQSAKVNDDSSGVKKVIIMKRNPVVKVPTERLSKEKKTSDKPKSKPKPPGKKTPTQNNIKDDSVALGISTDERDAAMFFFKEKNLNCDGSTKLKKKRLSTLKKRVLLERLQQHRSLQEPLNDALTIVKLDHYLLSSEEMENQDELEGMLQDDDEYDEIVQDVNSLAVGIDGGAVTCIPRTKNDIGYGSVFIEFHRHCVALAAKEKWDKMIIQGNVISASLVSKNWKGEITSNSSEGAKISTDDEASRKTLLTEHKGNSGTFIVMLRNVLSDDDLEDDECFDESITDLKSIAAEYGCVKGVDIDRTIGAVYIEYEGGIGVAEAATGQFNGMILGGESVLAVLLRNVVRLENIITDDDIEDEECMEETQSDIKLLAEEFGRVKSIRISNTTRTLFVEYDSGTDVVTAANNLDGHVLGGQQIQASALAHGLPSSANEKVPSDEANEEKKSDEPAPVMSGNKKLPERFAECKRVPKVPNSGEVRPYAAPKTGNDDVVNLLKELLGNLITLQNRMKDDPNARSKRRLVMGLREVARGIRAGKMKMIVLAYNVDDYNALDEKLGEILKLAKEAELPIFFDLNKRKLGKAIGKTIKVSITNPVPRFEVYYELAFA